MEVRILPETEWHRLADAYAARGAPLPKPGEATVVAVEREGRILGHVALHKILMVGLMEVDESYRGGGIGGLLALAVDGLFDPGESLFTLTTGPESAAIAAARGMVQVPGTLWRKDY
ncbi:MAG: hypothetical protein M3416_05400 [Acidobacteriota bacterium]|nr:hypothetical protein [Acidobacteriota bacterium]